MSLPRITYDLVIEKELKELIDPSLLKDKIASIDIDPVSKNVLLLVGHPGRYKLVLHKYDKDFKEIVTKPIALPRYLTSSRISNVRLFPNGCIFAYGRRWRD